MTQDSYNNYISNIIFHNYQYGVQIVNRLIVGDCHAQDMSIILAVNNEYIETLCNYSLNYYIGDEVINENCLDIIQMQSIVEYFNALFKLNYLVDFILE